MSTDGYFDYGGSVSRPFDPFGVLMLNPSSKYGFNSVKLRPRGWEYYSEDWGKRLWEFKPSTSAYTPTTFITDPYMHFRGGVDSFLNIQGNGILNVTNDDRYNPVYLSIYDENNLFSGGYTNALTWGMRWTPNIELTFYFNIRSMALQSGIKGGMRIHLTNDHHFIDTDPNAALCPYNSHDYILNIDYSGSMYLTGEPYHVSVRDSKPTGNWEIDYWDTDFTGIPLDNWYGIKIIKRTAANKKDVFFEVYRDLSEGANGGDWIKLFEFLHTRGNWNHASMTEGYNLSIANAADSIIPLPKNVDDPHVYAGGGQCQIEIQRVHELELKWLSIRDIEPFGNPPITTGSELTTESVFFDDNEADVL